MKKMSQRQIRVAEIIRQDVANILSHKGMNNPLIDGMITISDVWVSSDLRNAQIYFGCLMDSDKKAVTVALNEDAWIFQKEIASKGTSKYSPKICFIYDYSIEKAEKIDASLRDIAVKEVIA